MDSRATGAMLLEDMSEEDKSLTKKKLRRCISEQLRLINSEERVLRSEKISNYLYQDLRLKSGQIIAFFAGIPSEPDLSKLMTQYWREGVRVVLLKIEEETSRMEAYEVRSSEDLHVGKFKVMEPIPIESRRVGVRDLEVILIPGLSFHPVTGARLGRGKGYYDRYLVEAKERLLKVGVCFEMQLNDEVQSEAHDIPVDWVVHEKGKIETIR